MFILFSCFFLKFMKFVKKVGEGEVKIEDNQVKGADGKPVEAVADGWTEEFSKEQVGIKLIKEIVLCIWSTLTELRWSLQITLKYVTLYHKSFVKSTHGQIVVCTFRCGQT